MKALAGITREDYVLYLTTLLAAGLALEVLPLNRMLLVLEESERSGMKPDTHIRALIEAAIAFREAGKELDSAPPTMNQSIQ
jgi:hypothetical protein